MWPVTLLTLNKRTDVLSLDKTCTINNNSHTQYVPPTAKAIARAKLVQSFTEITCVLVEG